jgi:hypothetical protein
VSTHVHLQDTIIMEKEELIQDEHLVEAKAQDEHLEDIICLKLAIFIMIMDM